MVLSLREFFVNNRADSARHVRQPTTLNEDVMSTVAEDPSSKSLSQVDLQGKLAASKIPSSTWQGQRGHRNRVESKGVFSRKVDAKRKTAPKSLKVPRGRLADWRVLLNPCLQAPVRAYNLWLKDNRRRIKRQLGVAKGDEAAVTRAAKEGWISLSDKERSPYLCRQTKFMSALKLAPGSDDNSMLPNTLASNVGVANPGKESSTKVSKLRSKARNQNPIAFSKGGGIRAWLVPATSNDMPAPVDKVAKSGAKPSAPRCNEEDRSGSLNDETLVFPGSDLQPSGTIASQTLRAREQLTAVARALDAALMVRWSQQGVHVSVADGWARFFAEATRIVGSGMSVDEVESAVCGNLLSCSASSWVTQDDIRALFAFVQCGGSSTVTSQQWQFRVLKLEIDAQSCSQLSEVAATQDEEDSDTQPRRSFSASPASPERDQVEENADSIEAPAAGTRMEARHVDETDTQGLPSSVAVEEAEEPATVTGQIVTTVAAADIAEDEGLVKVAASAEDGAMADDVQCPATQHDEDEINSRCDRNRSECMEEDGTMSQQKDSKDDPDELEAALRDAEKHHSEKYSHLQTSIDHSSQSGDQELDAMLAVAANRRLSPSKPALDYISDTIAVAARSAPAASSSSTAASSSSSAASSSSGCVNVATGPVAKKQRHCRG